MKKHHITNTLHPPAPRLRADQVSIQEYRSNPSKYTLKICPGPYPEVGKTEVFQVPVEKPTGEIKVKVYWPTETAIKKGGLKTGDGLPGHVNYHGGRSICIWLKCIEAIGSMIDSLTGGWVIGGLQSDESWCRQAAQGVGMIIVDVDYRLAPEFPFPAQIWDSWGALKWTFSNASKLGVDTSRVSIGGLSAGGHISAVLAHLARDEPSMPALKLQMLVVPCVDNRWIPLEGPAKEGCPYETYKTCEFAPCLPLHRMRWFSALWLGTDPEDRKKKAEQWICSPILAPSHKNLASASIHCAEWDVLRSEAVVYNDLLKKNGVESRIKVYEGVCHPWGHWDGELEKAKEYVRLTCEDLRRAHAVGS